jgi:hypothetical protein
MPGTQVLTIANTTISGWSPQGQGSSAHSGDNAIDQDDATALVPTSVGVWNAVYVLPSSFAADSYRVLCTGGLTWRLQTGQGTTGADSEFTTQVQGGAGDTGVVALPVATGVREVRLNVTISATSDRIYSFEFYAGGEPVPATPGDVNGSLAAWLRDDPDNSHKDSSAIPGLPWTTKLAVDAARTYLNAVGAIIDQIKEIAGDQDNLAGDTLVTVLNRYSDDIDTIEGYLPNIPERLTGSDPGGGTAFRMANGETTASGVATLLDRTAPTTGFPDGYTLITSTTFDGARAWQQAAELYVVGFDNIPETISEINAAGVHVYHRLGWWAQLNGDLVHTGRKYLEFEDNICFDDGRNMPGILLYCPKGGSGTIEAWAYTG